MIIKWLE